MTAPGNRGASQLRIQASGLSDQGCLRAHNEDACFVDVEHGIFIVADGIGGHQYGDVASQMVVRELPGILRRRIAAAGDPRGDADPAIGDMLVQSVSEVGRHVHSWSEQALPDSRGMGATIAVMIVTNRHAHIAHMGDSRVYLFRANELRALTQDHTIAGLLMQNGEITSREAEVHPARGRLTRYVGMEAEVEAASRTVELLPGDRLLLCTDGLWGMITDGYMGSVLSQCGSPADTCNALVAAGNAAGGRDNLTALVVDVMGEEGGHETQSSG